MSNKKLGIGLIFGGLVGGLLAGTLVSNLVTYFDEVSIVSLIYPIFSGFLIGLFLFFIFELNPTVLSKIQWDKKNNFMHFAIFAFLLLFILFGSYIFNENIYISWIFLSIIFSISIWINIVLSRSIFKENTIKRISIFLGGFFGGIFGGVLISLVYVLTIDFSIDEGYFILLTSFLVLIGGVIGLIIAIVIQMYDGLGKNTFLVASGKEPIIISGLLILFSLLSVTSYNYWNSMNLNDATYISTDKDRIFDCVDLSSAPNISANYSKKDIIYFLENRTNKSLDVFAVLYLLSSEEKWAQEFKNKIIEDAQNDLFIGAGSYKLWQYETTMRGYYYNLVSNANPDLFTDAENELILNWFKKINEQSFKTTWDDYVYAFIFQKSPSGLYANQEIGSGMLSVLSGVLENKYPELSKKDKEFISRYGVGWKGNFRNPDDGIVYHQHLWIKNAFMIAKFGGQENYLYSNNSRNSFEWILLQWPPNGMSPAYNSPHNYTPFDIMALGAQLFHDGRYFWLSNKMLKNELENPDQNTDYFFGLEYWDDNSTPVMPTVGSCYIKGTTGIATKPAPIKPDKIVLREGWKEDSLYALLNLRFSGWHSYKATNSFISIMYGEPFVVEKLELKKHTWIPKGKADHRDKKIDRTELNGFQIEKTGLQKIIYQITGLGNEWAQDIPRFSDVLSFYSTPIADYSITQISDWHGWNNTRTSILVKGNESFLVVFDQNKGKSPRKTAISWHLKGEAEIGEQSVKLTNKNYSINVHFPHLEDWYRVEIEQEKYIDPPAGEIHKADYDFHMVAESKSEVGFVTLFYPERGNWSHKVENIDVRNYENESMYPDALAINVINENQIYTIGKSNRKNVLHYGEIYTDASIFIIQKNTSSMELVFNNATIFKFVSDKTPYYVEQNGIELIKDRDWQYSNGIIILKLISEAGYVIFKYQ